jgi:integrase
VLAKLDPESIYGAVDRAMVLTAAHTGLRKGELCGLRWSNVDLAARRMRVRRSFVRGEFDTPKSARGSRSLPVSTPLAAALETWRKTTFYSRNDDLVFAHPLHGRPLPEAMITRRFQAHAKPRSRSGRRAVP